MTSPYPRTFRARLDPKAISRVPRMFSATPYQIFTELLQNARRAGAAHVHVHLTPHRNSRHTRVRMQDNGCGIADPQVLLAFGDNGWQPDLTAAEDAAGMGFAALATLKSRVTSRVRGKPGWRADFLPAHFTGDAEATAETADDAPLPSGTDVTFSLDLEPATALDSLEKAARYYPLPVHASTAAGRDPLLNAPAMRPLPLHQKDFLDGALYRESADGLTFGVGTFGSTPVAYADLSFHGALVEARLPTLADAFGRRYELRAVVDYCPDLQLVLPARSEPVEGPFIRHLRKQAENVILRAMHHHPLAVPTFEQHTRMQKLGLDPQPRPHLKPWTPAVAYDYDYEIGGPPETPLPQAAVLAAELDAPQSQTLARLLAGVNVILYHPNSNLAQMPWYRRLPKLTAIRIELQDNNGRWLRLQDYPVPTTYPDIPERPQNIRVHLDFSTARRPYTQTHPLDLVLTQSRHNGGAGNVPLIAAGQDPDLDDLCNLLYDAYFAYNGDSDESLDAQIADFEEQALELANRTLVGSRHALRTRIAQTVRRHAAWLAPDGDAETLIRLTRRSVTVILPGDNDKKAA